MAAGESAVYVCIMKVASRFSIRVHDVMDKSAGYYPHYKRK
jgi:hypothetical protein